MRLHPLVPLCLLLGAGCVRDLPDSELGAGALAIFAAFDDDPASLPGIVGDVDAGLVAMDLDAKPSDRMFDLPELDAAHFGGADPLADIDTTQQMRVGMVARGRYGLDDELLAQTQENMTCGNAHSVTCHQRLPVGDSDAQAFLDGTEETYRTENTLRIDTLPVDFWLQAPGDFRWVTLDDGRRAVVGRTWIREAFANDGGKRVWKQRFGVDVYVEDADDPATTHRMYATWVGPTVTGTFGGFVQKALRKGLDDGFTSPDEWLDGDRTCDVDLESCLADSPF